jgi:transcriptional regulator with XRE-family HTH domain
MFNWSQLQSFFVGTKDLIRQIRTRLRLSQAGFAELLHCSQNSVSRYESGNSTPGLSTLLMLHDIGLPEERQIIDGYLKKSLAAKGKHFNPNASVDVLRGLTDDSAFEEQFLAHVPSNLREKWEPLIEVLSSLIYTDRIVDESIVEIIRLWSLHYKDQSAEILLRNVVGYLRVNLDLRMDPDYGRRQDGE